MSEHQILIGQVFMDAKPPHRKWRVVDRRDANFVLERLDKPNVRRFPDEPTLLDPEHYRPDGT
ncbi:hypothetical protein ACFOW6_10615 [Fodinicurvata halophila]|uniref:Uncharacterized protein n=1 Tax=Fodinicurvata halophila TaxID=1419723 RepID=A0ABV8UL86_9PROT